MSFTALEGGSFLSACSGAAAPPSFYGFTAWKSSLRALNMPEMMEALPSSSRNTTELKPFTRRGFPALSGDSRIHLPSIRGGFLRSNARGA